MSARPGEGLQGAVVGSRRGFKQRNCKTLKSPFFICENAVLVVLQFWAHPKDALHSLDLSVKYHSESSHFSTLSPEV